MCSVFVVPFGECLVSIVVDMMMMDDDPAKLSGQRQRAEGKGKGQMAKAKTRPGLARQDKERPDKARQEPRDVDHGRRHRLNALYVARAPPALKCVHVFGCPDTARQG